MSLTEVDSPPSKPKRPRKYHRHQKYSGLPTVAVPPDNELGPAMLELSPRRRAFVMELATGPAGYGSEIRAAKAAGYQASSDHAMRSEASRLIHHPKVQAALREVGIKAVRAAAFLAMRQTERIARDIEHRDCLKACQMLMDRGGFAVETHHTVTVQHKSLDDEALEALRTMRSMNASPKQLEDFFGRDGLMRYETMLAEKAKPIIDGESSNE